MTRTLRPVAGSTGCCTICRLTSPSCRRTSPRSNRWTWMGRARGGTTSAARATVAPAHLRDQPTAARAAERSEEHTSELQSHHDLVCRLLLEKKKEQPQ